MLVKDVIAELEKMNQNVDLKIYDYEVGKYFSNIKVSKDDQSINLYKI